MNSKITVTFADIPINGTELIIVDSAFPSVEIKEVFKPIRTQSGEVTITGALSTMAAVYEQAVSTDYESIYYIFTKIGNSVTIESTKEQSQFSVTSNTTSGRVTTLIENNSGSGEPTGPTRTLIDAPEQITFCSSPIHLRIQNAAQDATIESVYIYLWIWNGDQNKALDQANRTLFKRKVSASDTYINFEIADYIKAFLETPDNAPNTNQPNFALNVFSPPAITGQGVFWQIVADVASTTGGTTRFNFETNFATLGYRWNYEQNALGNNGLAPNGSTGFLGPVNKWYSPKFSQYFTQSFNLANSIATATTANMITRAAVTPPEIWTRCALDGSLIVYLNKLGLWDIFTPHGKITASSGLDSEMQNKGYRDPSQIDNTYQHSKLRARLDVTQKWNINTGSLTEDMINDVEQILYSPKVYLIKFNGEIQEATTIGITVDSTLVTVDDTFITVDSETIGAEFSGNYKEFEQIPVVVTDSDFERKNRVNDKNKIDYNIRFEETTNKILDIR